MAFDAFELIANVTASATWVQAEADGSVYAVPTDGRAETALIEVTNLGADEVEVELAISADATIDDEERIGRPVDLAEDMSVSGPFRHVMRPTQGLWVRATGATVNVTLRASILEVM